MIRERTSYSCVCDGCGYEQFDDYWSEDAALAQAEDDGWTYCEDSQGDWGDLLPELPSHVRVPPLRTQIRLQ